MGMKLTRGAKQLRSHVKPQVPIKVLAKKLGCDTSLISLWITGRRLPGRDMAVKLHDMFGIDVADWSEV